jgi:hypothetical protein
MIRCTTYLTLAAWVLTVPRAFAQQDSAYSYTGTSYGHGLSGTTGGGYSAGTAASSGGGSARALEVILSASGVPNQNGRLAWPLGLRLLRTDAQRHQVEAQLQLAAEQITAGGVNPQLLDEIRLNVMALRQLVLSDKEQRFSLPQAMYEDAERFLQKLQRAPQILAVSAPVDRAEASAH